ncbi:MAG: hypothetical protein AAB358_03490 [Patescibacteria group bacterium]
MKVQCCYCKKFRQDGEWGEDPRPESKEDVSHGICPPCSEKVLAEIEKISRPDKGQTKA